jgi:hypothetical protein
MAHVDPDVANGITCLGDVYIKAELSIHIQWDIQRNERNPPSDRPTAGAIRPPRQYLKALVAGGFLVKRKIGRGNYYINLPLYGILTGETPRTVA